MSSASPSSSILLDIDGMKCGGCVRAVENILLEQPNVINASVNLVSRTAWVDLDNKNQPIESILQALKVRGFVAQIRTNNPFDIDALQKDLLQPT